MFLIRKCPYADPLEFMVSVVAREAEAQGQPLTDEEKQKLRENEPPTPEDEFAIRIDQLVRGIIEREVKESADEAPISFGGAVEWAGDMDYPFVVQVAESVFRQRQALKPALKGRRKVIDFLLCVGCAILLILAMMAVSMVVFLC